MSIYFLYFSTLYIYIYIYINITFFFLQCGSGLLTKFLFCLHKTLCLCSFFLYISFYIANNTFFSIVPFWTTALVLRNFFWFELTVMEYRTAALEQFWNIVCTGFIYSKYCYQYRFALDLFISNIDISSGIVWLLNSKKINNLFVLIYFIFTQFFGKVIFDF